MNFTCYSGEEGRRKKKIRKRNMNSYNPEQLERYFSLISLDGWKKLIGKDVLGFFDQLVKFHLARITYNTLSLHYSTDKSGSLDANVLFDKIVDRDLGGYCFELNVFFLHLIRSLGFDAMAVGYRMRDQRSTSDGLDRWRTTYVRFCLYLCV